MRTERLGMRTEGWGMRTEWWAWDRGWAWGHSGGHEDRGVGMMTEGWAWEQRSGHGDIEIEHGAERRQEWEALWYEVHDM